MFLPVLVTDHWLSAVLIDDSKTPFEVLEVKYIKVPYEPSLFNRPLTEQRLDLLLHGKFEKIPEEGCEKIIIARPETNTPIVPHFNLEEIISSVPKIVLPLDYYSVMTTEMLEPEALNLFMNSKHYRIRINTELRDLFDKANFIQMVKQRTGDFIDKDHVVVLTTKLHDDTSREEYIKTLVWAFSDSIQIAGIWKFSFDDAFSLIPLVASLMYKDQDIEQFFDDYPLYSDAKLIIAPGIESIEKSEAGKEDYKPYPLKPNTINEVKLKENEALDVRWKSRRSKFQGELHGSALGLFIDTRSTDAKSQ